MGKRSYKPEKRRRELNKKAKKEQKRQNRLNKSSGESETGEEDNSYLEYLNPAGIMDPEEVLSEGDEEEEDEDTNGNANEQQKDE